MEFTMSKPTLWLLFFVLSVEFVSADDGCYGAGFVATSVVLSVLITLLVVGAVFYWIRRRPNTEHLILETDPEKGKAEYAFDNPGFKDTTLLTKLPEKTPAKNDSEKAGKLKWNNWSGISALTLKTDKKKSLDDSSLTEEEMKIVTLKSQDFAGLGFNICGNMKEGIYIKDILHRGPASESRKLNPGDRIIGVTIDFEHIVYEDALNILSFASPYEIIVEAKGSKISFGSSSKSDHPSHPIYRSTSSIHLQEVSKMGKKRLVTESSSDSNHSTLRKSLSNTTTLERKNSRSPRPNNIRMNEQLKNQLEQKISSAETEMRLKTEPVRVKVETQKTENKHQKFGIKVFPTDLQRSPKTAETSQNDNNINIEKHVYTGSDEVDKKTVNIQNAEEISQSQEQFNRNDSIYGSGLKRDENGIPQEIPSHMLFAAVAARRNRKSQEEILFSEEEAKVLRKIKGKAPAPPTDERTGGSVEYLNLQEISRETLSPVESPVDNSIQVERKLVQKQTNPSKSSKLKGFNSDSEEETDNQSSVNTIELNSSDITIHQGENEEKQSRKTASTGDLTKIHKNRESSSGTLERAQSLDITDSGIPNLTRKGGKTEDMFDTNSDEDFSAKAMLNKEPRLSLILDGLNTFQRNRLKKSTEWGNLEDAISRNRDDDSISPISDDNRYSDNFNCRVESAELNAVVNKINEIKKECEEKDIAVIEEQKGENMNTTCNIGLTELSETKNPKNQLWPTETETSIDIQPVNPIRFRMKSTNISAPVIEVKHKINIQNEIWPEELKKSDIDEIQINEKENATTLISIQKQTPYENKLQVSENEIASESKTLKPVEIIAKTNEYNENKPLNSPSKIITEFRNNISENLDEHRIVSNLNNTDPIIEIVANSITTDNMIVSETPPDDITELETIDSRKEIKNIEISTVKINSNLTPLEITSNKITMSNKMKTHKRQQIPDEENEIPLPPEMKEPDFDKEMFAEYNNAASTSKISDIDNINANSKLVAPTSSKSFDELPLNKDDAYLVFERNSETGELCKAINNTDETKTLNDSTPSYLNNTESFIYHEKYLNSQDQSYLLPGDTNISDDIKVSRHSFGSLERPKSDDAKSIESIKYSSNVSNVTVNNVPTENGSSSLHSLELSVNDSSGEAINSIVNESELYTTALNQSLKSERETSKISLSAPDLINNVTIAEAINTLNGDMDQGLSFRESSRTDEKRAITISSTNDSEMIDASNQKSNTENTPAKHSSLTYITEIQVTPTSTKTNVSEIEIVPPQKTLDTQQYSKNFEIENYVGKYEIKNLDPEKELLKIQEIAQEQLKKLPEMRFSTSSYESSSKNVEKRQSQIELLKSNFEKSPPKSLKTDISRSRIPISTTMKTPPTSPERESNMSGDNEKELFESMSYTVHSTPMTNTFKYQKPTNNKNITVTSIRTNSRIPSGLPIVSGIRPPVPPKRTEQDNDSLNSTSNNISSFKQWVFNPVNSVTNISSPGNQESK